MSRNAYRMTSRRKAALRKAQLASAKKRRRRRNVAIGAGVLVAGGAAAYGGYKYGPRAANIAGDLKSRTPKSVAGAMGKVRAASQPVQKEVTRIKNGLTRGFVRGAGPDAGQSKPRPRNITITDADRAQANIVRDQMKLENERKKSVVFGEGPATRQKYDEAGNVVQRILGIPGAVKRGKRLSGNKFSSILDANERKRVEAGGEAMTQAQREEIFKWSKEQGLTRGRYRNEEQRKTARVQRSKKRSNTRKRSSSRKRSTSKKSSQNWKWDARGQNFRENNP